MEEGELPVKVIKEECLLFEEDNTVAFYEYGDNFRETCQAVKKEGKDSFANHLDVKPKVEPSERVLETGKATEEADHCTALYRPQPLLETCPTEEDTSTRTTSSHISYLGAEQETGQQKKTENNHSHQEGLRTCFVLLQDILKSQDVPTGVYSEREGRTLFNKNIRVPTFDDFLYCQDCSRKYDGDCPKHGPLFIVEDTPVPLDINDKLRAKNSAPPQVCVAVSNVLIAGSGVLARGTIPARTRFGPYEGQLTPPKADAAHAWMVLKDGKPDHSIDASEPGLSNWMRFVNFARCDEEQNLTAFQYKGKVYFKTIREVQPGEELLVCDEEQDEVSEAVNAEGKSRSKGLTPETAADDFRRRHKGWTTSGATESVASNSLLEKENNSTLLSTEVNEVDRNEIFICSLCGKSSSRREAVASHTHNRARGNGLLSKENETLTSHVGSGLRDQPFLCSACDKRDVTKKVSFNASLKGHLEKCPIEKRDVCSESNTETSQNACFGRNVGKTSFTRAQCNEGLTPNEKFKQNPHTLKGKRRFECKQCKKKFASHSNLKLHLFMHSGEKPFECEQCKMKFARKAYLKSHLFTHGEEKRFECKQCKKKFAQSATLKTHILTHSVGKAFECKQCKKKFTYNSSLKLHLFTHSGEKPFECKHCKKKFAQSATLKAHLFTHSGEKPFECKQCKKKFLHSADLKAHLFTHTGEKPFECKQCKMKFVRKAYLKSHLVTHSVEQPFECEQCKMKFARKVYLKSHLFTHSEEKRFECKQCKKKFAQSATLKTHILTHSEGKPFECKHCKKKFTQSATLKAHLFTHSGEKPFECKQCKKKFTQSAALKVHLFTHSGEKPFECEHCKKKFTQSGTLKAHLFTHSGEKPFECKECKMKFAQSATLKEHLFTHNREKPFECKQCKMKFARNAYLKAHLFTHSGEKPFACEHCDKRFCLNTNLKVHMRKHTG